MIINNLLKIAPLFSLISKKPSNHILIQIADKNILFKFNPNIKSKVLCVLVFFKKIFERNSLSSIPEQLLFVEFILLVYFNI